MFYKTSVFSRCLRAVAFGPAHSDIEFRVLPVLVWLSDSFTNTFPRVKFQVYMHQRGEGRPATKRARCLHCHGDWAYNETRLKTHIIDPIKGCQKVPEDIRQRIREESADGRCVSTVPLSSLHHHRRVEHSRGPPPFSASIPVDAMLSQHQGSSANLQPRPQSPTVHSLTPIVSKPSVRIGIEFCRTQALQPRALWIASELMQGQFAHRIAQLALLPVSTEGTFNVRINDKAVWTRVPGQPAPDYEAIRPIMLAYFTSA